MVIFIKAGKQHIEIRQEMESYRKYMGPETVAKDNFNEWVATYLPTTKKSKSPEYGKEYKIITLTSESLRSHEGWNKKNTPLYFYYLKRNGNIVYLESGPEKRPKVKINEEEMLKILEDFVST